MMAAKRIARQIALKSRVGGRVIAPRRILFVTMAAALIALAGAPAFADPLPKPKPGPQSKPAAAPAKITTDTRVYLLRGLLNIFSLGMDALSDKLNAMGITSEVFNHDSWPQVASRIIDDQKAGRQGAVVLIGHSLGADVLFNLTERLERDNIPVRLVVPFDPTSSYEVTKNVDHLLNFYQLNGFGRRVGAPKGYKGELVNMDLSGDQSFGHGSIDKSERLHTLVIEKIKKVAITPNKKRSPKTDTAATTGSVGAKPAAAPAANAPASAAPASAKPAASAGAKPAPAPPAAPTPIANQQNPRT
jgi:hypothetical protein